LAGSGFAVQLIRTMLYGTRALDWVLFAEVGLVLSIVLVSPARSRHGSIPS